MSTFDKICVVILVGWLGLFDQYLSIKIDKLGKCILPSQSWQQSASKSLGDKE